MGRDELVLGAGRAQVNRGGASHGPVAEVDRRVLPHGWDVSRGQKPMQRPWQSWTIGYHAHMGSRASLMTGDSSGGELLAM